MVSTKNKVLAVVLAIVLVICVLPICSPAISAEAVKKIQSESIFSGGETSRMELLDKQMGLAFRFSLSVCDVTITNGNIANFNRAFVTVDGENKALIAVGVIMSNDSSFEDHYDLLTRENLSIKTIDIPVERLLEADHESIAFASRITNIPEDQKETVIYARPYYVYENLQGEIETLYGNVVSDNVSGKRKQYSLEVLDVEWSSGAIDSTGINVKDKTCVRSPYVNDTDVMVRVPVGVTMCAYFYNEAGFCFSQEIADWTVLSDLDVYSVCTNVRLVAWNTNTAPIKDAVAFGSSIDVLYAIDSATMPVTFFKGGFWSTDGTEAYKTNRIRTKFLPLQDLVVEISGDAQYQIFYYDEDQVFIYATETFDNESRLLTTPIVGDNIRPACYFRIIARHSANETIGDLLHSCASLVTLNRPGSKAYDAAVQVLTPAVYAVDLPVNQGVQNTILNFDQMIDITYTPLADIPQTQGSLKAGEQQTGIPYSSTRVEALFVPSNVGFYTFLSAVKNPNSYLYTVDMEEVYNNGNGKTYYGTVCSTSCEYALNILPMYSTHQWLEIPGMMVNAQQGVQGLQLCDTIVGAGHVVMITGIIRDACGKIVEVTVSEAAGAKTKRKDYTTEDLENRFPLSTYTYCHYTKIAEVQHTPIDYLTADSDEGFNVSLIPRKGDKANWLLGDTVEIDVLKMADYTDVELYCDGQLVDTIALADLDATEQGRVLILDNLPVGQYQARLVSTAGCSEYCYWMVVDASSSAVLTEDGNVRISFASALGTPLYVQWSNGKTNGTIHIDVLTEEQIAAGEVVLPPVSDSFKVRVAFRTEYGIVHAALPEEILIV